MPIFKISSILKLSDLNVEDKTAKCEACEYPATADNPIVSMGMTSNGSRETFSHVNCRPYQDMLKVKKEEESRQQHGAFSFASKFRFIASEMPENSTVETTFPTVPKQKNEVKEIVRTNANSDYDDDDSGASNPPSK